LDRVLCAVRIQLPLIITTPPRRHVRGVRVIEAGRRASGDAGHVKEDE
jgi:hypothetical protein